MSVDDLIKIKGEVSYYKGNQFELWIILSYASLYNALFLYPTNLDINQIIN